MLIVAQQRCTALKARAVLQVDEALQDTQQLQAELDKVQHRIRESERTVGASLESLQVPPHTASARLQQLSRIPERRCAAAVQPLSYPSYGIRCCEPQNPAGRRQSHQWAELSYQVG